MFNKREDMYVFIIEVLLAFGIAYIGSNNMNSESLHKFTISTARYIVYFLSIKVVHEILLLGTKVIQNGAENVSAMWHKQVYKCRYHITCLVSSLAVLVYNGETVVGDDAVLILVPYLIIKYLEMGHQLSTINYGVGMACSFFEGYLAHILPNDGGKFVGFGENIRAYESTQRITFPVKKLFIVVTKSLYCPPDLKEFNKSDKSLPFLEACQSLGAVEKDVAGVKNRSYRNSAYKIHRGDAPPVYLAVECATPVHTLFKVLQKKAVYEEISAIDPADIVDDFCSMVTRIVERTPECKGKCVLVYYDDTDTNLNLATLLLDKIREIEPNFENIRYDF